MSVEADVRRFLESRLAQLKFDIQTAKDLNDQLPALRAKRDAIKAYLDSADNDEVVSVGVGKGAPAPVDPLTEPAP